MGGRLGVWKGVCWDRVFLKEFGWVNMMEVCLGADWVCAWDRTWRFPGKFSRWILVGRCSGGFGWKFPDGSRKGDLNEPVVGEWNGRELGA